MLRLILFFLCGCVAWFSCEGTGEDDFLRAEMPAVSRAQPSTSFELISPSRSGITFVPTLQENFEYNFFLDPYEYNGGGVAALDVDNDGLQDLFFTHRFNGCRLYRNKGNFQFEDISEPSGVAQFSGLKTGVTVIDINADGWQDIYVCRTWLTDVPERRNLLFVNTGKGTFVEMAAAYGIDDPSPSQCANFFDYDLDGDLDLYVVNHPVDFHSINNIDYQPAADAPWAGRQSPKDGFESDKLFENKGAGRFVDVSRKAGIHNRAFGLSATTADFNDDGWPDLLVANDFVMPDFLYINDRKGGFRDEAQYWFAHMANHSMGCDIADLNNDALPDICIPDMLGSSLQRQKELLSTMILERTRLMEKQGYGRQQMRNVLQLRAGTVRRPDESGGAVFSEIGCLAGMEATEWSWAPLIADFDNDGWKDLFITAGVYRDLNDLDFFFYTADSLNKTGGITPARFPDFEALAGKLSSFPTHNFMFQNTGGLRMQAVSEAWGLGHKGFSNGAVYADLDNDGDLDLVVNKLGEPAAVYANLAAQKNTNRWLQIKCRGTSANPAGTGAKIWVYAAERVFYQEMTPTRGFYSSVEPIFQVGLGKYGRADSVAVEWPGGKRQVLINIAANQRLLLDIADAQPGRIARAAVSDQIFHLADNHGLTGFTHRENEFEDFNRERLLLHRFSRSGPCLAAGDLDGDGREDIFAGGAAGQAGVIFLQQADGRFSLASQPALVADARHEDTGAVLFDADGDGDLDLYVASGSNEEDAGADYYQDRLYTNDGAGQFTRQPDALPYETVSSAVVRAFDFDQDGDLDLFVGGRVVPGRFPETPRTLLLQNDGKGKFSPAPAWKEVQHPGMVTDLQFADLDGDGRAELIVCGEWMPIRILRFDGSRWSDAGKSFGLTDCSGLWNCLAVGDLDGDGDLDLVAGNEGLNTRLHASPGAPLRLFALDFDLDQRLDPIVAMSEGGRYYPLAQRNELAAQMPGLIRPKFQRYRSYARAPIEEVFDRKQLRAAQKLTVHRLESTWFENRGGRFVAHPLPDEAQISSTKRLLLEDFNGDGFIDMLLLGNDSNNTPETGPYDASFGVLLAGDGRGNWQYTPNARHGLWAGGDVRDAAWLQITSQKRLLALGLNNGPLRVWTFEKLAPKK